MEIERIKSRTWLVANKMVKKFYSFKMAAICCLQFYVAQITAYISRQKHFEENKQCFIQTFVTSVQDSSYVHFLLSLQVARTGENLS